MITRGRRLVQSAVVVAVASMGALAAAGLEPRGLESPLGTPRLFSGLAAGVFVTLLVAGTALLRRAADRKARPAWATVTLLMAYLILAVARHRASPGPADVEGLSAQHGGETFLILTATLGVLCAWSALADLRRIVRQAPSAVDVDWKTAVAAEERAVPWSDGEAASPELPQTASLSSLDAELADVPLMEEAWPPDLDAEPPARTEVMASPAPPAGRAKRLFE